MRTGSFESFLCRVWFPHSVHNNAGILGFLELNSSSELTSTYTEVERGQALRTGSFESVPGASNPSKFLLQCFHTFPQAADLFHVAPGTFPRSSRYRKRISTKLPVH